MEQYINQRNSELLTLLVDGQLEDSQATVLFSELTQNQDLRHELQQHLAIRESVRNDIEAYTTPLTLTQRVFASIGVNPSYLNTSSGHVINNINKPLNIVKRFGPAAVAVIITSLVTTFIVSNIYKSEIESIKSNIPVVTSIEESNDSQTQPGMQSNINQNNNTANINNNRSNNNGATLPMHFTEVSQDAASSDIDDELTSNDESINTEINHNKSFLAYINSSSSFNSSINPAINNGLRIADIKNVVYNQEISATSQRQYSVSLRGIAGKTYEGNHYGQQPIAMDFNAAVAFLVSSGIVENLQFGFEVGREPFHLSQVNIEEFLKDTDKDPNSAIIWGGVLLHYDMPSLALPVLNIYPWAQQLFGYSEHGFIAKSSLGIQYDIANIMTVSLGAEYSLLWYQYNLNWYDTNRFGVTSGVIFKF